MSVLSKIHSNEFKKKKEAAIKELYESISKGPIGIKQKYFMYLRMIEYKTMCEEQPENDENISNSRSNLENSWGGRNTKSLLIERSKKILYLENSIEELNDEIYKLRSQNKRIKYNDVSKEEIGRVVREYREMNEKLQKDNWMLEDKIKENEIKFRNENENLKQQIKRINLEVHELRKRENNEGLNERRKGVFLGMLNEITRKNEEMLKKMNEMKNQLKIKENMLIKLRDEIKIDKEGEKEIYEISKLFKLLENIKMTEVEKMLSEELKNIAMGYDKAVERIKKLEDELKKSNRECQKMFTEKSLIEAQIKEVDEMKEFIEKEKVQNEIIKNELALREETLENMKEEMETKMKNDSEKVGIYRNLLNDKELAIEGLQNELKLIKAAYEETKCKYKQMLDDFQKMKQDRIEEKVIFNHFKKVNNITDISASEINTYRKYIICSLCDLNIKNSVILNCMHCFCAECINNRFKSRHRKCPVCETDFSLSDIKKFYL